MYIAPFKNQSFSFFHCLRQPMIYAKWQMVSSEVNYGQTEQIEGLPQGIIRIETTWAWGDRIQRRFLNPLKHLARFSQLSPLAQDGGHGKCSLHGRSLWKHPKTTRPCFRQPKLQKSSGLKCLLLQSAYYCQLWSKSVQSVWRNLSQGWKDNLA